ncbi:imidazole glycerol phosphate synthase subunit HisF [Devosia ginsengisoli]|uniref:Imidazole glycerol phosphate synthase subunit HisF n=1 Tax=Devosia ginsengisoli TaxID=400770 RepID=A0A5B8LUZ0_9HYPH|nr:imidazole glycerol phosphate synthase subunit HisF [Devosia ginsengisoli]QDZ11631.1 imidazole glycerol phosphate synthase subunit HisF [Devosia ginsengisoli]
MTAKRLIARLDVKAPNLIKGINLEGLRKLGEPGQFAQKYYAAGIDEIIYMDIVASLYDQNSLGDIVSRTSDAVFIPITVGGGIRSLADVQAMMRSGADKVAINTAAIRRPELISDIANTFGAQCMVVSIEAKQEATGRWQAYVDNGREKTGLDVVAWARQVVERGAGEILLTSVDREGTRKGFDLELIRAVSDAVPIPVIASGGMGTVEHLIEAVYEGHADAVAMADVLHYDRIPFQDIRARVQAAGVPLRKL